MYTFSITIRRVGADLKVIAESSEPGITAAVRAEDALVLDVSQLPDVPTVYSDRAELLAYGTTLGQAVFAGRVGRAFQRAQRAAEAANDVLHVLLSVEEDEFRALRWERMCGEFDGTWQFLRLQQRTPFSLHLPSVVDRRYPSISRADLKALVVVANLGPTRSYGLAEFDAAATVRGVREALGEIGATVLACDGAEEVAGCDGLPTLDEICARITAERHPILHLVCHAKFEHDGETYLFLHKPADAGRTGPDDFVHQVAAGEFLTRLEMIQGSRGLPHLAFLCCCDSAAPEATRALGGLGQRLVYQLGMPAVVGMTESVAISFAGRLVQAFYERLRIRGAVDLALAEACAGVAGHGHVLVPMIFSRLAGRTLFDVIGPLTTGEWEAGLRRLSTLIDERAPMLGERFEGLRRRALPALEVRKATESRTDDRSSSRQTAETLANSQADLNEICQDFLADSFDSVARGLPLAEPGYDGRCPFPGLGVFDNTEEGDFRPFFFGRETLTQEVRQILEERRFVAILGGSGTGKSSLVRAGLLEAMKKENPGLKSVVFPPGKDPLARLELDLKSIPDLDVIVVDQFEELFTLVADDPESAAGARKTAAQKRREFLARLLPLRECCLVVVTLRADFLAECAEYDELYVLLDADQKHLKLLQPLRGDELRDVMERQAKATNLQFEPGLAAQIFQDIESEPGAMPLLQHCLRQLWQFRHGRWLRLAEYVNDGRVGGVKGAISRTAEDVYRRLGRDDQAVLPYIFESLARIDTDAAEPENRRDTRRREELAQLTPDGGDPEATKRVVSRLADAKLLVTSQNPETGETEVEVAHEVLIRHWRRLRKWLDAARDTAKLVERIRSDTAHYFGSKASPDNLTLRGTVLEEAGRLIESKPTRLSERQVQFVRLCLAYERERSERELRTARTRLWLVTSLAGLTLVVTLLGVNLRISRVNEKHQAEQREKEAQIGRSREVAASAVSQLTSDPELSILLALEAWRIQPTTEAVNALRQSLIESHLRTRLSGHAEPVTDAAFSPNGRLVVTASREDGRARIWEATTGRSLGELSGHRDRVNRVAFSPDGKLLVTASEDKTARVWDVITGVNVKILEHDGPVREAVFSPNGKLVATASFDKTACLWELNSEKSVKLSHENRVNSVAFSRDGKLLATASVDKKARVWEADTGKLVACLKGREGHTQAVSQAMFSPDGERVVTASSHAWDTTARVWEARTGNLVAKLKGHDKGIQSAVFSPDGELVVTASVDMTARVWEARTGNQVIVHSGHRSEVTSAEFSHDGGLIVTASADQTARVWKTSTAETVAVLRGHRGWVYNARFSPDSNRIVTASSDKTACVWDCDMSTRELSHGSMPVRGAAFSHDGQFLVTACTDGVARVWRISTQKRLPVELKHNDIVRSAAFSPDGSLIVTVSPRDETASTRLWNAKTGDELRPSIKQTVAVVNDAAFSPDGKRLATASEDRKARVCEVATGKRVTEFGGHRGPVNSVAFSSDGRWVVTASTDGTAQIWEAATGKIVGAPLKHGGKVNSAVFSPGREFVMTAGDNGEARIWDTNTGESHGLPLRHDGEVKSVTFSHDGKWVVTASKRGPARVWVAATGKILALLPYNDYDDVNSAAFSPDGNSIAIAGQYGVQIHPWVRVAPIEDLLQLAPKRLTRNLTPEERARYAITAQKGKWDSGVTAYR